MSNAESNVVALTRDAGLGTLSFVQDSTEVFGRLTADMIVLRGSFDAGVVRAEGKGVQLTLMPIAKPVENGPRLRGTLLDTTTGDTKTVVAWRPTKGGSAYGLSEESPIAQKPTYLPF